MSAISDAWVGFAQNNKSVEGYIEDINNGILPVFRGHLLIEKDLEIRTKILDLMCHFNTALPNNETEKITLLNRMSSLIADGIVEIQQNNVYIPPRYRGFVRNVCMCFDEHLLNQPIQGNTFSKTI
jgi:oxygen-independent coproporphyrinogen-3 oxidase